MTAEETTPNYPVTFSQAQVREYLEFLQFTKDEIEEIQKPTLENLAILVIRHLATAPFSSVDIHYSKDHTITIAIDAIFDKVVKRKRGGYCMELNNLFSCLLATLGFNTWLCPSRATSNHGGDVKNRAYHGISHCVNLVEFEDGKKYLVDVGYGGAAIVRPMELIEGTVIDGVGEEQHRLIKATVPEARRKELHWLVQHKLSSEEEWTDLYMFFEVEAILDDCVIWSNWSSTQEALFKSNILVAMVIREGNEPVGKYTLWNGIVRKKYQTELEYFPLVNEEERVKAFRTYFGIELSEEDAEAIKGREPELKPADTDAIH
ncbi:N-terminal acetyltransferase [Orbilia oligospora]|uniref:N-terminal acetyltransferase n=1 Tax=Orbilia oligospora TaxID=2813651 RepID=A0A8H2HV30_ORBOL|nr:N-terminal acetyltransferase [Orbilia oligospora]KAF3256694.1 N-terminal acetyltransferase [Orbilia oligospora]KAF3261448.1 N-terminal acetyltransferase [Orbilia oligospora]KAF3294280.1 N-terminal acetyltransferase [Orbilia oligospora]TGJ70007.1 N-terminal acetyltransferase [Orbilia oligospora]